MEIRIEEVIREERRRLKISQEVLAGELGVTVQAVSKWETGISYPDVLLLPQIAAYFGISMDELFLGHAAPVRTQEADGIPDDGVLRVIQCRGRKVLERSAYDPAIRIPLRIEGEGGVPLRVEIWGSADIEGDVQGSLTAGGGVNCGNVEGNATAGCGMNCGNVEGNATAGCGMNCGNVEGHATAGNGMNCGNVEGNVSAGDAVSCGDIGGDASAGGNIECESIGGSADAGGRIACDSIGGDARPQS